MTRSLTRSSFKWTTVTCRSLSSQFIRDTFLDFYGTNHGHEIVPSTSVIPSKDDPTLQFVNAGMIQFKDIFLGREEPRWGKAANVQKCIRTKDLHLVGFNGRHQTFFEMMGSWSFGSYGKAEACRMAQEIVLDAFKLPEDRIFVTYFNGCDKSGLSPDLETRDLWLSLGMREERVIGLGPEDNFWQMGLSGPCGPCTEIYFDHRGSGVFRPQSGDVVELFNLVFMEFERDAKTGQFAALGKTFVDAGFGLERLAAVLNGSASNYDSDLFRPLFEFISLNAGAPAYKGSFDRSLDSFYRILADHARTITVCTCDGLYPDSSPRLKSVFSKALDVCSREFNGDHHLLTGLCYQAAETLHSQYPEIGRNINRVDVVIRSEVERLKRNQAEYEESYKQVLKEYPRAEGVISPDDSGKILAGLKRLENESSGDWMEKMYLTCGINTPELMASLARIKNLAFDEDDFERMVLDANQALKRKSAALNSCKVSGSSNETECYSHVYKRVSKQSYQFPMIKAKVLDIIRDESNGSDLVYLDKTTFYAEAGGQVGDRGLLTSEDGSEVLLHVDDCQKSKEGVIAHIGRRGQGALSVGQTVQVRLNSEHRIACMQNHTGTHLLNAALNSLLPLTAQKSSFVSSDYLKFEFSCFDETVDLAFLQNAESLVAEMISAEAEISRTETDLDELIAEEGEGVVLIPGERYPDRVSVIRAGDFSSEPCCGTHLRNTADVQEFVVVDFHSAGFGVKSVKCLTGQKAFECRERGKALLLTLKNLKEKVDAVDEDTDNAQLQALLIHLQSPKGGYDPELDYPYEVLECRREILSELVGKLRSLSRKDTMDVFREEMKKVLQEKKDKAALVHFLHFPEQQHIKLSKVMSVCPTEEKPVLILAITKEGLRGQAQVPWRYVTGDFNAETWLKTVAEKVRGKLFVPAEKDSALDCYLLPSCSNEADEVLKIAFEAERWAENCLRVALESTRSKAERFVTDTFLMPSRGKKDFVTGYTVEYRKIAPNYFSIELTDFRETNPNNVMKSSASGDVVLINYQRSNDGVANLEFLTNEKAEICLRNGEKLRKEIERVNAKICQKDDENVDVCENVQAKIDELHELGRDLTSREKCSFRPDLDYPWSVLRMRNDALDDLSRKIESQKERLNSDPFQVALQKSVRSSEDKILISHFFDCPDAAKIRLPRLTKSCPLDRKAVLLVAVTKQGLTGRACLPDRFVSTDFNARKWVEKISAAMAPDIKTSSPPNQENRICNFTGSSQSAIDKDAIKEALVLAQNILQEQNFSNVND